MPASITESQGQSEPLPGTATIPCMHLQRYSVPFTGFRIDMVYSPALDGIRTLP